MTDRRELKRQYRETARPMGVFRIHDTAEGRSHVGRSVDLPAMLNRQRFQLESGDHPDKRVQAAWNASDGTGFEFETLDTIEPLDEPGYDPADDLDALAEIWRDRLRERGERLFGDPGA